MVTSSQVGSIRDDFDSAYLHGKVGLCVINAKPYVYIYISVV